MCPIHIRCGKSLLLFVIVVIWAQNLQLTASMASVTFLCAVYTYILSSTFIFLDVFYAKKQGLLYFLWKWNVLSRLKSLLCISCLWWPHKIPFWNYTYNCHHWEHIWKWEISESGVISTLKVDLLWTFNTLKLLPWLRQTTFQQIHQEQDPCW